MPRNSAACRWTAPDLDGADTRPVTVFGSDSHRLDADHNGVALGGDWGGRRDRGIRPRAGLLAVLRSWEYGR
jgi:hypothetical protein